MTQSPSEGIVSVSLRDGILNELSLGFGGGCHWCTEAVFNALIGVSKVEQGFISSIAPADALSEAVQLSFDPNKIPLAVLIEIHLRTHSSTSNHVLRAKYRSAIYTTSDELSIEAAKIIKVLQPEFCQPLVTQVLPLLKFQLSPEHYQQYYQKNSLGAFCQRYVDPKLALIRERFAEQSLTN